MNTQNFTLMQLNAQEQRHAILRQAQQDQLLATLKQNTGSRSPFDGISRWMRSIRSVLTGAMSESLEKRTVVRSHVL